ncbi:MAG TPA: hypothetical protein VFW73_07430, partial [Lacipirellulaceae bacterium]|nr:hypothetical protein [Lacipirellulaceae bacterium]
ITTLVCGVRRSAAYISANAQYGGVILISSGDACHRSAGPFGNDVVPRSVRIRLQPAYNGTCYPKRHC